MSSPQNLNIHMVCLGNICRSPIAEAVLREKSKNVSHVNLIVSSSGTANYHIGEDADRRAKQILQENNYPVNHTAQATRNVNLDEQDIIFAMDTSNLAFLRRHNVHSHANKSWLLRSMDDSLDPIPYDDDQRSVPDPYYDGNFQEVLEMIESSVDQFLEKLKTNSLKEIFDILRSANK